jgi:hypothetical protein
MNYQNKLEKSVLAAALSILCIGSHAQISPGDTAALPQDRPIGNIEAVHEFYDAMPTGVTRAPNGRIFVNFPRWGDEVPFTVGEIVGNHVAAYPNADMNRPTHATLHPVCLACKAWWRTIGTVFGYSTRQLPVFRRPCKAGQN